MSQSNFSNQSSGVGDDPLGPRVDARTLDQVLADAGIVTSHTFTYATEIDDDDMAAHPDDTIPRSEKSLQSDFPTLFQLRLQNDDAMLYCPYSVGHKGEIEEKQRHELQLVLPSELSKILVTYSDGNDALTRGRKSGLTAFRTATHSMRAKGEKLLPIEANK